MTSLLSPIGAARPRVEVIPEASDSLGDVAIALVSRAGLTPEPWQADSLRLMMAVRPDGRWAADEYAEWVSRQQGKSGGILLPRALCGFLVLGERLIMWSAHLYATAMESFISARNLLRELGEPAGANLIDIDGVLIKVCNTNGEEGFERLDTGARWRYLARSKASGRGFSGDTNIIDEAFAFTSAQKAALFPTMTARPNPQAILASTPPLDKWSGDVMFAMRKRALTGDTEGLAYRDWGVPHYLDAVMALPDDERKAMLDDEGLWLQACPAVGHGRVSIDAIRRLRRTLSDEDFAREVLGMWPTPAEEAGGKIPAALWSKLVDRDSQIVGAPVFAVEVSRDRNTAAIVAAGMRADERVHIEIIEDRPGIGLGWVPERVAELQARHSPAAWMVDPLGPAGPLIGDLEAAGATVTAVSGRQYVQACGELFDAVATGQLRYLPNRALDDAAVGARARDVGDGGWAWARRGSPVDIFRLCGATLAHHGLRLRTGAAPNLWL